MLEQASEIVNTMDFFSPVAIFFHLGYSVIYIPLRLFCKIISLFSLRELQRLICSGSLITVIFFFFALVLRYLI